jgi:hypothetical protein
VVHVGRPSSNEGGSRRCHQACTSCCGKESGLKLQVLRADNDGMFTAVEFVAYYTDGVWRHYSTPYSPQQNGMVERRNQTVVATARALLKQRGMPTELWGEAVMTMVHLLNRSPTKSLEGKTPYEAWHGRTPAVGHLRTFVCLAYVKGLNAVIKLSDESTSGVFIGYAEGVKAYHILNPVTLCVRTAWDVIFDEGRSWDWSKETNDSAMALSNKFTNDSAMALSNKFTIDYAELKGFGGSG